jgi:integrase/recombinase XerD
MLSVYTRHHSDCAKKDDSTYRRCCCPKWLNGTLPGRSGRFCISAKTKSWECWSLLLACGEHPEESGEHEAGAGEEVEGAEGG